MALAYKHFLFFFLQVSMVVEDQARATGAAGGDQLGMLRILRVIRLARLAKLLKVLKASAVFKRWESRIGMQYSTMTLIKWFVFILMLCHWLACAWHTGKSHFVFKRFTP